MCQINPTDGRSSGLDKSKKIADILGVRAIILSP